MNLFLGKKRPANRRFQAIVAVSTSLAAFPAAALEFGELTVQSRLGQPIRASVAYALGPNERLTANCVSIRQGATSGGLPGIAATTLVSVANGLIKLTGTTSVTEPIVSAQIVANCAYSANLSRQYILFIDPPLTAFDRPAATQQTVLADASTSVSVPATSPRTAVPGQRAVKDIVASTAYRVQPGDSLSNIAQRIENRSSGLWDTVNTIFVANPGAFTNNNPDRLKTGSWLSIPSFDANKATLAKPEDVMRPVTQPAIALLEPSSKAVEPIAPVAAIGTTISNDWLSDNVIVDSQREAPRASTSVPVVPAADVSARTGASDGTASTSWFVWLAGSLFAIVLGLTVLGRRSRNGTDATHAEPMATQAQPFGALHARTQDTQNIEAIDVDYNLSDDSPTEENLILVDADLITGTGLEQDSTAVESQDFEIVARAEVDAELPIEAAAVMLAETDMLATFQADEQSILVDEVLPESAEDWDDNSIEDQCDISTHADYVALEQNYEDEMLATQALSVEIGLAAAEPAANQEDNAEALGDETTALPLARVAKFDITAKLRAENEIAEDIGDTTLEMTIKSDKAN